MSRPLKLGDPAGGPRFALRGEAKREPAIWERNAFGPWICRAWVVPITGLRHGYPLFEVGCSWEKGPSLGANLGPEPIDGMAAVDVFVIDREAPDMRLSSSAAGELAIEIAKRASEHLEDGIRPNLPRIARICRRR